MKRNILKITFISIVVPVLALVACTNKEDSKSAPAQNIPAAPPSNLNQSGGIVADSLKGDDRAETKYSYRLVDDNCETPQVEGVGLGQLEMNLRFCEALKEGSRNNNCALRTRKDLFEKQCLGQKWTSTDTIPVDEKTKELKELRDSMSYLIAADASSLEGTVLERLLGMCGFSDETIKCQDVLPARKGGGSTLFDDWEKMKREKIYARSTHLRVPIEVARQIGGRITNMTGRFADVDLIFAFDLKAEGGKLVPTKLKVYQSTGLVPEESLKEFFENEIDGGILAEVEIAKKGVETAIARLEDVETPRELYHLADYLMTFDGQKNKAKVNNALRTKAAEVMDITKDYEYEEALLLMVKNFFSNRDSSQFLGLCEQLAIFRPTLNQGLKNMASAYLFASNPTSFGAQVFNNLKAGTEAALKTHRFLEVRIVAAEALAKNGQIQTSPTTQAALFASLDDSKEVSDISKKALAGIEIKVSTLQDVIKANVGPLAKIEALGLLSEAKGDSAAQAMTLALGLKDKNVRAEAIAKLSSRELNEETKKILKDHLSKETDLEIKAQIEEKISLQKDGDQK